jgi:hypothetical protein
MKLPKPIVRMINLVLVPLLRSPMHWLASDKLMVLSFNGRRSGRRYTFPVSYLQQDAELTCFSANNWWHNISEGTRVELSLRGQPRMALATRVSRDVSSVRQGLCALFRKIPADAAYYGVPLGPDGTADGDALSAAAHSTVMIRMKLVDSLPTPP